VVGIFITCFMFSLIGAWPIGLLAFFPAAICSWLSGEKQARAT
jgi:hypothetical protein